MAVQQGATELLQQELQDIRSMEIQTDHVRWLVTGDDGPEIDRLLRHFTQQWQESADKVAKSLVRHGEPPDGRIGTLSDGIYRGYLPKEWVEGRDAARWVLNEIEVLCNWSRLRSEQAVEDADVAAVCNEIAEVMESELTELRSWADSRFGELDPVDEIGVESFPASDAPSSWAGPPT